MLTRVLISLVFAVLLCVAWVAADDITNIPHNKLGVPFKKIGSQSLEAGGSDFYQLKFSEDGNVLPIDNTQTLFFMVTPVAGDVDLYVRARAKPELDDKGNCPTCIDQSTTAHGDFVQIAKNSIKWPTGSDFSFYILVKGASDTVSSYTLTVWISDQGKDHKGSEIILEDGFPQVAVVLPMQYTYFKFKISNDAEITNQGEAADDIVFLLTPFSGDPDIFISTEAGTKRPTPSDSYWRSLTTKTEIIKVTKSDPHYTRDGYYYIGIRAFGFSSQAYFMISATTRKRYTHLIESVSLESLIVDRLDYNYYKYYMPVDKAYEILIAASQIGDSDPDLFVYPELDYDAQKPPSNTKCKWCHQSAGDDNVLIPKDQAAKGYFYIGVRSWKPNTAYSLMAITERNNIFLRDGIPAIIPTHAGKYQYFKFFNYDEKIGGLTFSAYSVPGSHINLYYSKPDSRNTHPTKEKHDSQGLTTGSSSSLILYGAQPKANHYFSVLSDTTANVTVTAATNTSATILQNQVPLPNIIVNKDTYRYFIFDPTVDSAGKIISDITINLGVLIGEADLYVSADETRPTKEKCDEFKNCWNAVTFKADAITISPDDPKIKGKNRLYIAVSGLFYETSFVTIMAGMTGSVMEVSDGVPVDSSVKENDYTYFAFRVTQKARVIFQLSLSDDSTEASMYASLNPKPTKVSCEGDNSCYISERIGDDVIDKELEPGLWYVSILGNSPRVAGRNIPFQFKASSEYHIIQPSSRASPYLVETTVAGTVQQIKVSPVFVSSKWLAISTSLITGRTRMYLNPGDKPANKDSYKYKSEGWPGNILFIEKTAENEDDFKQSKWTLGIEGVETSDYWLFADYGSYYTPPSVLPNNIPRSSKIVNTTRHYSIDVDSEDMEDIYLNMRVMKGGVQVIIGQNYTYPLTKDEGFFYSEGNSNKLIKISKSILQPRIPLKITVSPFESEEAIFEFTVSRGNAVKYVVQDQPQTFIAEENSRFVLWNSKSNPKGLSITLESDTMEDAPEFYVSSTNEYPNEKNYEFKSRSNGAFKQTVQVSSGKMKYNVGIGKKHKGKLLTLSATTRQESVPIMRSGTILATYISEENGYRTYRLNVPRARPPKGFEDSNMVYDLYFAIVGTSGGDSPTAVNMKTVGGIQYSMQKIATHITKKGETGDVLLQLPKISVDYVYQVNVIAHNGLGLQAPYDGFWVVNGEIYPNYPTLIDSLQVSPGTMILIFFAMVFTLYFLIGSIVNIVRGKKGLDVIPQRHFWTDLPYLVLDGVLFITTCCKRGTATSFENLDDEVDNDIGQLNLGTKNARVDDSDEDMGGYGAI